MVYIWYLYDVLMCVFYTSEMAVAQGNTLRNIPLQACLFALTKQSDKRNRLQNLRLSGFMWRVSHADVTHCSLSITHAAQMYENCLQAYTHKCDLPHLFILQLPDKMWFEFILHPHCPSINGWLSPPRSINQPFVLSHNSTDRNPVVKCHWVVVMTERV